MDLTELLRAIGSGDIYRQGWQKYQENIGEPIGGAIGGFGRGFLGLDRPDYGGEVGRQAHRTGEALSNMPGLVR